MKEVKLTLTVNVEELFTPEDVVQAIRRLFDNRVEEVQSTLKVADVAVAKQPRVLVLVSGGVADHVVDGDVDIEIFDQDSYEEDPEHERLPSEHFADLAHQLGIPMNGLPPRIRLSDFIEALLRK